MMKWRRRRIWVRWVGEAMVIVASVFVAIYLEGAADDAERVEQAHGVLAQLASELAADRDDIPDILEQQARLAETYTNLLSWLANPRSLPGDSVQVALDYVANTNRTLYPRSGAWRALTSGGQLVWIGDQRLVTRLADFYENRTVQLEFNGRDYDFNVNEVMRVTTARAWDHQRREARAEGRADLVELSGQIRYLGVSWNPFYIDLLGQYGREIDELLRDIDVYLSGAGDT